MEIPEINIQTKTINVESCVKKMTIRNMFYRGFWGKIKTIYYWIIWISSNQGKTFKEYLDSPVTYVREFDGNINAFHSLECEKEIEDLLLEELLDEMYEYPKEDETHDYMLYRTGRNNVIMEIKAKLIR